MLLAVLTDLKTSDRCATASPCMLCLIQKPSISARPDPSQHAINPDAIEVELHCICNV